MRLVSKSILIPLLAIYYILASKNINRLLLIALILAWVGDLSLLSTEKHFFILGLGSFLIMHILYAIMFYRENNELTILKAIFASIIILPCLLLLYRLIPFLDHLLIPVIAYAFAIVSMLKTAIFKRTSSDNYILILSGALSFFVSDLILAHNLFDLSLTTIVRGQLSVMVMILYTLGQYLIVEGFLKSDISGGQ